MLGVEAFTTQNGPAEGGLLQKHFSPEEKQQKEFFRTISSLGVTVQLQCTLMCY